MCNFLSQILLSQLVLNPLGHLPSEMIKPKLIICLYPTSIYSTAFAKEKGRVIRSTGGQNEKSIIARGRRSLRNSRSSLEASAGQTTILYTSAMFTVLVSILVTILYTSVMIIILVTKLVTILYISTAVHYAGHYRAWSLDYTPVQSSLYWSLYFLHQFRCPLFWPL